MPDLKVWMVQSLFAANPSGWVEAEHLGEQIDGLSTGIREEGREWDPSFGWESGCSLAPERRVYKSKVHLTVYSGRSDTTQNFLGKCSSIVQDLVELVNVAVTKKLDD
jgi:hypothetical protein